MNEIWKDIIGYEGMYQVSNLGRVKSIDRIINNHFYKSQIIKSYDNGIGYYKIKLCKNGKIKHFYLHRLVAQAFLEDYSPLLEINHINHNKKDNDIRNLELVSHLENMRKAEEFYGGTFNKYGFAKKIENKERYCISCGKKIYHKSIRCKECWHKKDKLDKIKKHNTPCKEELERAIKKHKNFSEVAREYGVSHTTVMRWRKKYNIGLTA